MNIQQIKVKIEDKTATLVVHTKRNSSMYEINNCTNEEEALKLFNLNSHRVKLVGTISYL